MSKSTSFLAAPQKKLANQLVYIVYGDTAIYHMEAKLSILSILAHTKKPNFTIRVMTDHPQEYQGWPIEALCLTPSLLQEWLAGTNYHYRQKAMGILTITDYADKTIFVDTDTLFRKNANNLFKELKPGHILVDEIEKDWQEYKQYPDTQKIRHYLETHHSEFDNSLKIINSGVFGVFKEDKPLLEKAITFIDEMAPVDHLFRTLEQFSFALAFDKQRAITEQNTLKHYFSKKVFFHEMAKSLFNENGSIFKQELISKFKEMPNDILRPSFIKRFFYQKKASNYPKEQQQSMLRLLYAMDLKKEGYVADQAIAYWRLSMRDLNLLNPKANTLFQQGEWPQEYQTLANKQKQSRLLNFLKKRNVQ